MSQPRELPQGVPQRPATCHPNFKDKEPLLLIGGQGVHYCLPLRVTPDREVVFGDLMQVECEAVTCSGGLCHSCDDYLISVA